MDRPTEDTLPYQGGRLVVASQCLATGDRHMWVVLAHYPDRGEWWATEGIYYIWLYNSGTKGYVAGVTQTMSHLAVQHYADTLKNYMTRYLDDSKKNS